MAALTWSASDLGFSCGFRMWHRLLFFLWVIRLKLFSGLFLLLIANSVKAQSIVHFSLHFHPKPCAKHTFKAHLLIVWLIDLGFSHLTQFYHRAAAAFFFFNCSASDLNVSSICTMVIHIIFFLLLGTVKFT